MGMVLFNKSGTFNPSDYGLSVGDQIQIVCVGGGGGGGISYYDISTWIGHTGNSGSSGAAGTYCTQYNVQGGRGGYGDAKATDGIPVNGTIYGQAGGGGAGGCVCVFW